MFEVHNLGIVFVMQVRLHHFNVGKKGYGTE